MTGKKHFNDLPDSILNFSLIFLILAAFLFTILVPKNSNTNLKVLYAIAILLFLGSEFMVFFVVIISHCFEYWIIFDEYICQKSLFRRKTTIYFNEILSITVLDNSYRPKDYLFGPVVEIRSNDKLIRMCITKKATLEKIKQALNWNATEIVNK